MTMEDHEVIEKVAVEYFRDKNITTACPKCGKNMIVIERGNSYIVKCIEGCIEGGFRGV